MQPVLTPNSEPSAPTRRFVLAAAGSVAALASAGFATAALADSVIEIAPRRVTVASFTPLIGQYFLIGDGTVQTQLMLVEVVDHPRGKRPDNLPDPFSLIFSSPWNETLPGQIYETDNNAVGRMPMFITPIGQDRYEAAFN